MNMSAGGRRGAGVDECECGIMFLLLVNIRKLNKAQCYCGKGDAQITGQKNKL